MSDSVFSLDKAYIVTYDLKDDRLGSSNPWTSVLNAAPLYNATPYINLNNGKTAKLPNTTLLIVAVSSYAAAEKFKTLVMSAGLARSATITIERFIVVELTADNQVNSPG